MALLGKALWLDLSFTKYAARPSCAALRMPLLGLIGQTLLRVSGPRSWCAFPVPCRAPPCNGARK